jgi:hypothetical protein
MKQIIGLGAAADILREQHRTTAHCEHPRTCGGCHFWSGAMEACRDLRTGDKRTAAKALAIIRSSQNAQSEP